MLEINNCSTGPVGYHIHRKHEKFGVYNFKLSVSVYNRICDKKCSNTMHITRLGCRLNAGNK